MSFPTIVFKYQPIAIARYLRATKWRTPASAIERLEETLKWRREYGLYDLVTADLVAPEVGLTEL